MAKLYLVGYLCSSSRIVKHALKKGISFQDEIYSGATNFDSVEK